MMKALCWHGKSDVRLEDVDEPRILNPRDAIIRVTRSSICGTDLHIYDGFVPSMHSGDILGHEFMGEVVEVGPEVHRLKIGDRVVVPFTISCGACHYCTQGLFAHCDNSNPSRYLLEDVYGPAGAGLFGSSHLYGGYAGGQSEYVRVPFADVGPLRIPEGIDDDRVLFLGDLLPTAYMAAENCHIQRGETVAVWGCGPVGLLTIQCCYLLGAERVIAIDSVSERLRLAANACGAQMLDMNEYDVLPELMLRTGGRGPDACIDAVGLEAHGHDLSYYFNRAKEALSLESDRPIALREAIQACRKGGAVSIAGAYGEVLDRIPLGAAFARGLTIKMGRAHVQRYTQTLLRHVLDGDLDPTFIITHRLSLSEATRAYELFKNKEDGCIKVVLHTRDTHWLHTSHMILINSTAAFN